MWAVNLISQVLKIRRFTAAGPFPDRPLDVVRRHVRRAALEQHHAQARVHVGVSAAQFGGNTELARQFGEDARPLGVNGPFEMLDLRPFAVSRHSFQLLKRYVGWHASRCDVLTMQRFNVSTRLFYKHRRPIT